MCTAAITTEHVIKQQWTFPIVNRSAQFWHCFIYDIFYDLVYSHVTEINFAFLNVFAQLIIVFFYILLHDNSFSLNCYTVLCRLTQFTTRLHDAQTLEH